MQDRFTKPPSSSFNTRSLVLTLALIEAVILLPMMAIIYFSRQ
ncbi:MAG TPA: hypothetical protein VM939_00205 [Gemmatimonadaceae bacterium]|nr:hypothetical protein [Gemmatimonadaceae bacterium]